MTNPYHQPKFMPKPRRRDEAGRQRLSEEESAKLTRKWEEERAGCAENLRNHCSHTRHYCLNLPCNYCHKEGHIAPTCPRLATKRAAPQAALEKKSNGLRAKKPHLQVPWPDGQRRRTRSRWEPKAKEVFPSYHCPGMSMADEEEMGAKDGLIYATPLIIFPCLRTCITSLLDKLAANEIEDLKFANYPAAIEFCGPRQDIITEAMAQIEPEVIELEGQILSPELLQMAQTKQFARVINWPVSGGYVCWVTDDRYPKYIRYYPGQSFRLPIRVSIEHPGEIRNGSTKTLHYFVLARGHGHRFAHFLRLWSAPSISTSASQGGFGLDETRLEDLASQKALARQVLVQNLMEMTFCRVFESLPGEVLTQFFGPGDYSNVGLNNLPPLFQGHDVPASVRAKYLEYHRQSPDPDISAFVDTRKKYNSEKRAKRQPGALLRSDYRQAVEQLIRQVDLDPGSLERFVTPVDCITPIDVRHHLWMLETTEPTIGQHQEVTSLVAPIGSPQAKIGVVISSESVHVECDGLEIKPLDGLKLSEKNSLIWTSSFEQFGSGPSRFQHHSKQQQQIRRLNNSVITQSGIRVIVLCGLRAQQDILSAFKYQLSGPHKLPLRDNYHNVWFLHSDKEVSRMFITSPEPMIKSFLRDAAQARRSRDVFGVASTLTGENIGHTCWEDACFHAALFTQARREKEGAQALSAASLDPVFRTWLHYRGFVDDADVQELERTAGSLTIGLFQITTILSLRSRGHMGADSLHYRGYRGKYDAASYAKTHALFTRIYERRFSSIRTLREAREEPHIESEDQDVDDNIDDDHFLKSIHEDEIEDNPIIKVVHDIISVETDDEDDDGKLDDDKGDGDEEDVNGEVDEAVASANPETPEQRKGPHFLNEKRSTRQGLSEMLTVAGTEIYATKASGIWSLATTHKLVRFTVHPEGGITFCNRPLFAIRAHLSPPGTPHPNRVLGNLREYLSTDPCFRLSIEYRLLDNGDGRDPSSTWHWAAVQKRGEEKASILLERIYKANTLVDLLEGRTARELESIPRRSLKVWLTARKKTIKNKSNKD